VAVAARVTFFRTKAAGQRPSHSPWYNDLKNAAVLVFQPVRNHPSGEFPDILHPGECP